MSADKEWWRGAVFYQIAPRSFCDTTGNGIGDLPGATARLDHVASLNVDGIWITPFYPSPMEDFGYDVADYRDVDPLFGTLNDFDVFLTRAHGLGLKVIIDLPLSHTSDKHPWFTEKPEYYVWTNEPNNWVSVFGGSAWEYHEERGQYYLHNFLKNQPDLNFHNPDVQREMLDICKFWLERGVDGLRLDVCNFYFHDTQLRGNPPRKQAGFATQLEAPDPYNEQSHIYDKSQPENFEYLQQIRALADEYNAFVLGELGDDDPYKLAAQYTDNAAACHSTYNPQLMGGKHKELGAALFRTPFANLSAAGGNGWPSWAFSNHDVVRAASRWCPDGEGFGHDPRLSRMLIALLGCLRGSVFIYQGEELGLPEVKLTREQLQDPWGKHLWPVWQGRDGCRTPVPWSADTPADQWLPVPDEHIAMSVATQENDTLSTLNFTRAFLKWRAGQPALIAGNIEFHDAGPEKMLHFTRSLNEQTIVCQFTLEAPYDFSLSSDDWAVSSSSFSSSKPGAS